MVTGLTLADVEIWLKSQGYQATLAQLKQESAGYTSEVSKKFVGNRGKSFKKQMIKAKKSSWRGVGPITTESRSIKFEE